MADADTPKLQVEMQRLQSMADQLRELLDKLKQQIDAATPPAPSDGENKEGPAEPPPTHIP